MLGKTGQGRASSRNSEKFKVPTMVYEPRLRSHTHQQNKNFKARQIQGGKHRDSSKSKVNPEMENYQSIKRAKKLQKRMAIRNLPKLNLEEINNQRSNRRKDQKMVLATRSAIEQVERR